MLVDKKGMTARPGETDPPRLPWFENTPRAIVGSARNMLVTAPLQREETYVATDPDRLKIPKKLKEVTLWVHPLGRVVGSLFLREQSVDHAGEEEPLEVLNRSDHFIVLHRDSPEELRFYNRASIIRVEYPAADTPPCKPHGTTEVLPCQLHMMDGSLIAGTICEPLPPDHARLFDYLNRDVERFIRIYLDDSVVCLVNKSYIIQASPAKGDTWSTEE